MDDQASHDLAAQQEAAKDYQPELQVSRLPPFWQSFNMFQTADPHTQTGPSGWRENT